MLYAKNKKAYYDYTVIDSLEAGIKLTGSEVKAVRNHQIQLKGSYVVIKDGQLLLTGSHIAKLEHLSDFDKHDVYRDKILLVNKKEFKKLSQKNQENGITLMVLDVYQPKTSNHIKVTLALCKGKKNYDKRVSIKEKDSIIDTKRAMKDYN